MQKSQKNNMNTYPQITEKTNMLKIRYNLCKANNWQLSYIIALFRKK